MRTVLFFFSLLILYSCSNDSFEGAMLDSTLTRGLSTDSIYCFDYQSAASDYEFDFQTTFMSIAPPYLLSYVGSGDVIRGLRPEVISKPDWVTNIGVNSVYINVFMAWPTLSENTMAEERVGTIRLRQPESNKILSLQVKQGGTLNRVTIGVIAVSKNRYEFTARTHYPTKAELRIRVPLVVYNDGGELTHDAVIVIAKGKNAGSYLMDWNDSPLVRYHGDLKGYRLYEGSFYGDDNIYTYGFVRYW